MPSGKNFDRILENGFFRILLLGQLQRKMTLVESLDSSCPCNLNANLCDINCCCDKVNFCGGIV